MDTFLYWVTVLLYSAGVVYIGYRIKVTRGAEEQKGSEANLEFWMARRQLSGWRLGISLTSGWLMLGWIAFGMSQIYMYGATALWILPIPWFILCFIIFFMVPFVRRIGAVSLPQGIEKRYGPQARTLLAIFSFGVFISWTQAELFMAGVLMQPFLGVPAWLCMVLLVVPIILYTYLGGFRAIVTTDLVQFLVMAIFMVILAIGAITAASNESDGNIIGVLKEVAPPWSAKGEAFNLFFLGSLFPVVLLLGYLPGWMIEQDLCLRLQAVKSTREAKKGALLALVLITVFILILPSIAAFCALVVFPPVNGAPPDAIGSDATSITSAFIGTMPLGICLFMLVGIVACQMSTVDTFANVSAMALAYDIVEPVLLKRKASPKERLSIARYISIGSILAGLLCAFISDKLGDVYYISSGVLSASIAIPALFIFWRRTTLPAVMAASIVGFVGTVGGYFYEYKFLQVADPDAPHYYINELPGWLQNSYGY
ncbi:MAG: sodium:solute symporter family protein, partial [Planctomycetes bacterium]|nr:sodium:solute symporter family protein [Planctomycetota bacterium]